MRGGGIKRCAAIAFQIVIVGNPKKPTRVQYPGFGSDFDVLLWASGGAEEDGALHHKSAHRHINFLDPGHAENWQFT